MTIKTRLMVVRARGGDDWEIFGEDEPAGVVLSRDDAMAAAMIWARGYSGRVELRFLEGMSTVLDIDEERVA